MKIKVCGITSFEQLQELDLLAIDFAGLIFYEGSKRFVGDKLNNHQSAIKNFGIKKVGVFVNVDKAAIKAAVDNFGLSYVQLHGNESPEFCKEIRQFIPVIKAIQVDMDTRLDEQLEPYQEACDYFLFDTASKQYGGSGLQFNWDKLMSVQINKPFFLSGGIGPEDVEKIKAFRHTDLFVVDINSRFETSPGIKNMQLVKSFVQEIKQ
jgi:phosphoribosylanthranilate isomerase